MKTLVCLVTLIVILSTACDQGQQMIKPTMNNVVADDPQIIDDSRVATDDTPFYIPSDVNQDGNVDDTDVDLVDAAIGTRQPANPRLDVDGNGIVERADLSQVYEDFGKIVYDTPQPVMSDLPPITFENATNLMPGERYRFLPGSVATTGNKAGESVIPWISWSNVDYTEVEPVTVPEGSPQMQVEFKLKPRIYQLSVGGVPVITIPFSLFTYWDEFDEIVVEIIEKLDERKARNGDITVNYTAVAIENLTRPNRKFEFEEPEE